MIKWGLLSKIWFIVDSELLFESLLDGLFKRDFMVCIWNVGEIGVCIKLDKSLIVFVLIIFCIVDWWFIWLVLYKWFERLVRWDWLLDKWIMVVMVVLWIEVFLWVVCIEIVEIVVLIESFERFWIRIFWFWLVLFNKLIICWCILGFW